MSLVLLGGGRVGSGVVRGLTEGRGVVVDEDGPAKVGSERGRGGGPDEVAVGGEVVEVAPCMNGCAALWYTGTFPWGATCRYRRSGPGAGPVS